MGDTPQSVSADETPPAEKCYDSECQVWMADCVAIGPQKKFFRIPQAAWLQSFSEHAIVVLRAAFAGHRTCYYNGG